VTQGDSRIHVRLFVPVAAPVGLLANRTLPEELVQLPDRRHPCRVKNFEDPVLFAGRLFQLRNRILTDQKQTPCRPSAAKARMKRKILRRRRHKSSKTSEFGSASRSICSYLSAVAEEMLSGETDFDPTLSWVAWASDNRIRMLVTSLAQSGTFPGQYSFWLDLTAFSHAH